MWLARHAKLPWVDFHYARWSLFTCTALYHIAVRELDWMCLCVVCVHCVYLFIASSLTIARFLRYGVFFFYLMCWAHKCGLLLLFLLSKANKWANCAHANTTVGKQADTGKWFVMIIQKNCYYTVYFFLFFSCGAPHNSK